MSLLAKLLSDQSLTLATWAMVVTGLGAIVFAYKQLRSARQVGRVENLQKLVEWFDTSVYLRDRQNLAKTRLQQIDGGEVLSGDSAPSSAYRLLDFFEHVAWLVEKGYVDAGDVWCAFYDPIIHLYEDLHIVINDERQQQNDNTIYDSLQKLVETLNSQHANQGGLPQRPTIDLIRRYYEAESELPVN